MGASLCVGSPATARAYFEAEVAGPLSDSSAGRDRAPMFRSPRCSNASQRLRIPALSARRYRLRMNPATEETDAGSVQSKVNIQQLLNVLQHLVGAGFIVFRSAGCCFRRYGVRINQPNESGSDVPRPWLQSHVLETPKEHA